MPNKQNEQGAAATATRRADKSRDTTKVILRAIGYTPATLANDLEITISVARRILSDTGGIYYSDLMKLVRLLDISPNTLCGFYAPGNIREGKQKTLENMKARGLI